MYNYGSKKYHTEMKFTESQNIELKPTWRDEYLKEVSAFANSEGGTLLIGVDDKGNPIGLRDAKKLLEDIPNTIRNKLGIISFVEVEKIEGKEILKIKVNSSPFSVSYNGKFYIRTGSTKQELTGQDLTNFLLRKSGITWDEIVEEGTSFEDINAETIEKFKTLAEDKIPSITKEKDWKVILKKLEVIQNGKIKRAGILLYGKDPQKYYREAIVKIGKFKTDTDIITTDIVSGNLFEQLENSLEILRTKYLKSDIKFEGIHRRDVLEYPEDALREAVINALIHRDYFGASNIQIRVYDDKLIIMNEGKLPPEIPVESLKTIHLSKPKNPLLASVFYFAGFIENWGRGTLKIVESCLNYGLPEPDFKDENGVISVIFYKDKFSEEFLRKMLLNKRQIKAVMYAKEKGEITLSSFRTLAQEVTEKTLYRDLQDLVSKGILKQVGDKKGRKYELQ